MLLTEGQVSDYKGMALMVDALPKSKVLFGDKGYDADWVRHALAQNGIAACIPSKTDRKVQIEYGQILYRSRHKIENMFGRPRRRSPSRVASHASGAMSLPVPAPHSPLSDASSGGASGDRHAPEQRHLDAIKNERQAHCNGQDRDQGEWRQPGHQQAPSAKLLKITISRKVPANRHGLVRAIRIGRLLA
jgi:IS5 family transposase